MELEIRRRTVRRAGALARWRWPLGLLLRGSGRQEAGDTVLSGLGGGFGYRLRAWPALPAEHRTAAVYRALSIMGERVVSVTWLARRTGFALPQAQEILDWLAQEGYAEQIPLTAE